MVELGDDFIVDGTFAPVIIEAGAAPAALGDDVFINFGTSLRTGAPLRIGSRVDVGPHCTIDSSQGAIEIGDDVWLGARVEVRASSRIGPGAVIGAGSIVMGDVPPACVAAGRPAVPVRWLSRRGSTVAPPGPRVPPPRLPALEETGTLTIPEPPVGATSLAALAFAHSVTRLGPGGAIRGRPRVRNAGAIEIGARLRLDSEPPTHLVSAPGATLRIGNDVRVAAGSGISAHLRVEVGDDVWLGPGTLVLDFDFHGLEDRDAPEGPAPVRIGDGVRAGARVLILRGVSIGPGARICDDAVVTRDVPAGATVAGAPARPTFT
jgi:acetyltransferase-like isoleucine patch superfamily enzyme